MSYLPEKPEDLTRLEKAVAALAHGRVEDSRYVFTLMDERPKPPALHLKVTNGAVEREASVELAPIACDADLQKQFDAGPDDVRFQVLRVLWERVRTEV